MLHFSGKKEIIHSFFLLRFSSFSVSLISLDCHFKCLIFLVRSVSLNLLLCVYVNAVRSNCTQCSNCTNTINAARVQQLIIHGGDLWSADAHVKVSAILNVHVKVSAIFFMSTWRWAQFWMSSGPHEGERNCCLTHFDVLVKVSTIFLHLFVHVKVSAILYIFESPREGEPIF